MKFNRDYQFFSKNSILVVCHVPYSAFLLSWKMMKGLEILLFFPLIVIIKFEFTRYLEFYYYFNYCDLNLSWLEYNILGSPNYDKNCHCRCRRRLHHHHYFIFSIFMEFSINHY